MQGRLMAVLQVCIECVCLPALLLETSPAPPRTNLRQSSLVPSLPAAHQSSPALCLCLRLRAEATGAHIAAVRTEFDSTHQKMDRVHAEAAALGGALLGATAAAAAAGSAVRQIVRPGAAA